MDFAGFCIGFFLLITHCLQQSKCLCVAKGGYILVLLSHLHPTPSLHPILAPRLPWSLLGTFSLCRDLWHLSCLLQWAGSCRQKECIHHAYYSLESRVQLFELGTIFSPPFQPLSGCWDRGEGSSVRACKRNQFTVTL